MINQPRHAASCNGPSQQTIKVKVGMALDSAAGTVSRIGAPGRIQISRFLAAAGIALAALVIAVVTIRVRREDLAGAAGRY